MALRQISAAQLRRDLEGDVLALAVDVAQRAHQRERALLDGAPKPDPSVGVRANKGASVESKTARLLLTSTLAQRPGGKSSRSAQRSPATWRTSAAGRSFNIAVGRIAS